MTKQITLTQGKVANVSDHRFEYLNQFHWRAYQSKGRTWYACRQASKPPFFETPEAAAKAYDTAAKELGEYAWTNF